MKVILKRMLCFFGKHRWAHTWSIHDPENHSRECVNCHKIQLTYKGDWFTVK